jgi:hypothetical protein
VSSVVAADLLAVSDVRISSAVRIGLIKGHRMTRRIEIPLSEVRRYGNEFVPSEWVVRELGLTPQRLISLMRSAGIEPAGHVYGTHHWRRLDVEAVLGVKISESSVAWSQAH